MQRIDLLFDQVKKHLENTEITDDGCWLYRGTLTSNGYGQMSLTTHELLPWTRKLRAHRVSYAFFNHADPGDLLVCHHCDNPACVNPEHLFLGTDADNAADKAAKGRTLPQSGSANFAAKLGENEAREVIRQLQRGQTNKAIARKFGVSHSMISLIRTGKAWQEVANDMDYEPSPCFRRRSSGSAAR